MLSIVALVPDAFDHRPDGFLALTDNYDADFEDGSTDASTRENSLARGENAVTAEEDDDAATVKAESPSIFYDGYVVELKEALL